MASNSRWSSPTIGWRKCLTQLLTNLDGAPDGCRAMNDREAIKVLIEF
jgi:hypothetical protein